MTLRRPSLPARPEEPLASRTTLVPRQDPLSFLAQHAGEPRFYYRTRGFALAGVGIAREVRAQGDRRWTEVRDQARAISAGMRIARDPAVPKDISTVWIGGVSFEETVAQDATEPFPAARFVLPAMQLRVQADGTFLTTCGTPDPPPKPTTSAKPPRTAARPVWTSEIEESEWATRVRAALHQIQSGSLEKVVLARSVNTTLSQAPDLVEILGRLQSLTPQSTIFLVEPTPGQAWLGASPEILARRSQGRIETAALAGSRPRGQTPDDDLLLERSLRASSKDAWEHELVCRFIRSTLDEPGRNLRVTQDRGILKLPNVQHLETRFEGDTPEDEHLLDVAARLHPTPAVSGSPRGASVALVRELEPRPRGWYAGALGLFDARGDGELVVGIRSARVDASRVRLTAGCGIVSGSDPVDEWNEAEAKFQIGLKAFDVGRPLP
jgi:menaquinone-specific isochorismate synthase